MKKNLKHWFFILLLFFFIALMLGYVVYIITQEATSTGQVDQLSERAQEFISKDTADGEGIWSTKTFEKNPNIVTSDNPASGVSTPCFSLTVPVASTNYSQEQIGERCIFRAKLLTPLSQLVISSYPSTNPDEDTGILLRQQNPSLYTNIPFSSEIFTKTWLFKGEDHVTVFAWKTPRMITISVNGVIQKESINEELFTKILNSMTLYDQVSLPTPSAPVTNSATMNTL